MELARTLDVQSFINSHKLSGYQILIVVLCFFIIAVDGFDTAAIGYIAPAIKEEWGLTPAHLAPLFGAGLLGLMVGAFVIGPFADKFGRKPILLFSVGFFGLASLASGYATSPEQLLVLRFVTGLGLGGAMPNAITVTSEYCPEGHRSVLVTTMFCGFTLGSALGGVAAAHIVADFGWRAVLLLGGVLPLAFVPILWWKLPESVRYLVLARKDSAQVTRVLKKMAPQESVENVKFTVPEKRLTGFPVKYLFDQGLLRGTLLMWIVFFMSLLVFYLLTNWLPTVIKSTGVSMKDASLTAAMLPVGSTVGAILIGQLMDRINPHYVLTVAYALAGLFIALIGSATALPWLVVLAVFGAGLGTGGSQIGANALAAAFYPTASRATGVAWALGIGRIGSVVGSMIGGLMLSFQWSLPTVFQVAAIPAFLAAVSIFVMGKDPSMQPASSNLSQARSVR